MNPLFPNLRRIAAGVAVALGSLSTVSHCADPSATPAPATQRAISVLPEEYQILLTRNIFCRHGNPRAAAAMVNAAASQPAQALVLRGVVHEDEGYVAVFEDLATNQIQHIRAGEAVAGLMVSRITMRGVELSSPAKLQAVAIGENLAGEAVVAPPVVEQPTAAAPTPGEPSSAEPLPAAIQANAVIRIQDAIKVPGG
jgi:hypothetical protein